MQKGVSRCMMKLPKTQGGKFMKHKTITNKLVVAFLTCGMLASLLTGCGNSNNASTQASESKTPESSVETADNKTEQPTEEAFDPRTITEGVTLTIAIKQDAKVSDYENNLQTKHVEEALGVNLDFIVIPASDYQSKLNVMVMGGEKLPDIIFNPSSYTDWIDEGAVLELSEYYDNPDYSANIREGSEKANLDVRQYLTQPDGTIYAVPRLAQEIYNPVRQKLWVYQPWLDALGVDVPETTEEYYEVCKLVASTDLNGNGKQDEVGLTGTGLNEWFDCLMSAFVYAHDSGWRLVEDGKVSYAFVTDEWKEGLKYIKKFFDEGLIPVETLTQAKDQYQSLWYAETPTLFSFAYYVYNGSDAVRRSEYSYIPALKGPNGEQNACNMPTLPSAGAVITTDCENPLAAFLVCDYLCGSDNSVTQRYGEKGVDWDYWDVAQTKVDNPKDYVPTFEGYEISFLPYDMIGFWSSSEPQDHCWRQAGPAILYESMTAGAAVLSNPETEEQALNTSNELYTAEAALACTKYIPDEVFDYAPFNAEEKKVYTDIGSAFISYVRETTCAFLTGDKDIDAEWDAYLAELDKIGYNDYVAALQVAYDRVH